MRTEQLLASPTPVLCKELWKTDDAIYNILCESANTDEARDRMFNHLNEQERTLYNVFSDNPVAQLHANEKENAKQCIRILKNIIRTENENVTNSSALEGLYAISKKKYGKVTPAFVCEMIALFKGAAGKSHIYDSTEPEFLKLHGREAATARSSFLDSYSRRMDSSMNRYGSGLGPELIALREKMKKKILKYFESSSEDWKNYRWHLKNAITELDTLKDLVKLSPSEKEGVRLAEKHGIPFQITPYYASLFIPDNPLRWGRAIRAQVLPSPSYCCTWAKSRKEGISMDFMGEQSTSPIPCVTRRYPGIVILKPYDSCPQICVYCQRNWEIKNMAKAVIRKQDVERAIEWIREHTSVKEVLVTGGDPLILSDEYIEWILNEISKINHIHRIRIGTRTLVTLPSRITPKLVGILGEHHELGKREVCVVTHVEHPTEITPETLAATRMIREEGMSIYNQQVFTYFNSKKFETCKLRRELKLCGIDPYYTFNTKGKDETTEYRVPIARIEQERKEEARLMPGVERTDEPVFNVPRLGKSHLRAWQDHEVIMVLPDGRRVYRFYPWESKLELIEPYDYTDVSIYDYMKKLASEGEKIEEYKTIWYYF